MNIKSVLVLFFFLILYQKYFAQTSANDFMFEKNDSIIVKKNSADAFLNPWSGGMNQCQFSEIDLNNDHIKDLFVFDVSGNKISTFINLGIPDSVCYNYEPSYIEKFPVMHDWVLLRDFNCDGKEDIFTYTSGGFAVYRNDSDSSGLKFTLITNLLKSHYFPNNSPTNLYVSSADIPSISDIDNDGDLDVLTFYIFNGYIQYHRNMSMERYGVCDSLIYEVRDNCWGDIFETSTSNAINMSISCPFKNDYKTNIEFVKHDEKHTGSTLLSLDLNGDGRSDMLIGDIGYRTVTSLIIDSNCPQDSAVLKDTLFPSYSVPINMTAFPSMYNIDINNDNKKDLLVCPNSSGISENFTSVMWYKNDGTNSFPHFIYQTKDIIQNDMIDLGEGAYPVIFDYNNDGLQDLIIGNYGYYVSSHDTLGNIVSKYKSKLALFENVGTINNPRFELKTRDWLNLSLLGELALVPTFGDLDGDGDKDLILGCMDGRLSYYVNNGGVSNFSLSQSFYKSIDVGFNSAPQLIDVNGDDLLDLVLGAKDGKLHYFQNIGNSVNPDFSSIATNNYFGKVKTIKPLLSNDGYSVPCFFKKDGKLKLFVGSNMGYFYYYKNIEDNLNSEFTLVDSSMISVYEGFKTSVAVSDINNDGYFDVITGNSAGGVAFFKGKTTWQQGILNNEKIIPSILIYPTLTNIEINIEVRNGELIIPLNLEFSDIVGHVVLSTMIKKSSEKIDVSELKSGIYFCSIKSNNIFQNQKIIIQH